MQKLHGIQEDGIGSQDARAKRMNVHKKNVEIGRNPGVLGRVSWIADELIGIRPYDD